MNTIPISDEDSHASTSTFKGGDESIAKFDGGNNNNTTAKGIHSIKLSSTGIRIAVSDPVIRGEKSMISYIVYAIRGCDKDGEFEVYRRYSEFYLVRNAMVNRWPGCYVPPMPPKKAVGNKDATFVEERKRFLDIFCRLVSEIPHLYYSEEFQIFLRSNNPEIEKILTNLSKPSTEEIISKYTVTFNHLSGKELNNETVMKIVAFQAFLKKAQSTFKNYKTIAKATAHAKKDYYELFDKFHSVCLVEYEKNCLAEYTGNHEGKFIFHQPNNQELANVLEKIKTQTVKPSLELIYDYMKAESYEIDAFLEAISMRDKYETLKAKTQEKQKSDTEDLQKIIAGKTVLKTIFSRKSKEEDISILEKQIVMTTKEIENLTMLHDMITLIISYYEITKFKEEKLWKYHRAIKECAEVESINCQNFVEYWSIIFQNANTAQSLHLNSSSQIQQQQ